MVITQVIYLAGSQRAIWNLQALSPSTPIDTIGQTVSLFGSALVAIPVAGVTIGTASYSGTFFAGGIALPLLYVGLFSRRDGVSKFLLWMLAAIPVLYLVALLMVPIQEQLGSLKSFQLTRVSHLFPFVIAANAGIGCAFLLNEGWQGLARRRAALIGLIALFVALGIEAAFSISHWDSTADGPPSVGWLLSAIALGGGALAGAAVIRYLARRRPASAVAVPLLLVVLVVLVGERAVYARAERFLGGGLGAYADYMVVDPGFAYIQRQPNPEFWRTLTAGFPANRAAAAGLDDAGGYESMYPLSYHELFGVLTDPHLRNDPAHWAYFHDWGNRAFPFGPELDLPVADLMGIRWVWTWGMPIDDPQLVPRFNYGSIIVYENRAVFPRAFMVNQTRAFSTEASLLRGLAAADDSELRATAFVVNGDGVPVADPTSGAATGNAVISVYTPDRVDVWVQTPAASLLVLTDTYAPGWTATVCGSSEPISRVDAAFRAVQVPAGTCTVSFRYRPWFTYAGIVVSGLSALALAVFSLVMLRRDRSRSRSSSTRIPNGSHGPDVAI